MKRMLTRFDEILYLQGDEDGDVSVHCRRDDRHDLPIIFYTPDKSNKTNPYHDHPDVVVVHTITGLINACIDHCDLHATLKT